MRRRTALAALVIAGVAALLAWYVSYTRGVADELKLDAERTSRMIAAVHGGLDTSASAATTALFDLSRLINEAGVPLIITNADGAPAAFANLPATVDTASPTAVRAYAATLDALNPPVTNQLGQRIHFGSTPLVQSLQVVPAVQVVLLASLLLIAAMLLRTFGRAERDRVWAGMARESAHQIGTPLSSLHGWIEVLRERAGDPLLDSAIDKMGADIERLERVAHRFERIGRPPKRESIDLPQLIERVVQYFRVRVPTLTTPVTFDIDVHGSALTIPGDRVLLEWVLESLIKNSVDALSGTGGRIAVSAESLAGGRVRIRVADDGPGVPPRLRSRIFDAGFTTKERGWGIGLALTKRIVEENHGGRLALAPTTKGAAFDVILPA